MDPKKLTVFGASAVAGQGLRPGEKTFAHIVAEHFNLQLKIVALPGASNHWLLRQIKIHCDENPKDFILVNWQTEDRDEWQDSAGKYHQITAHSLNLPAEFKERYQQWVLSLTEQRLDELKQAWHDNIFTLHNQLNNSKIKHLFFNYMYSLRKPKQTIDWHNSFVGPYDNNSSWYWYLVNCCGIQADEWYHFKQDGHEAWAEFLINYIQSNNLL